MLIALIVPLVAACGSDDDDSDPTATTAAETTGTEPPSTGDATPTEEEEDDATATEEEADASPTEEDEGDASPTTGTGSPGGEGAQTFGPFSAEDVMFGQTNEEGEQGGTFIEGSFSDISTLYPI